MGLLERYRVIGLMSGTSLDGLDVAYAEFSFLKKWSFKLIEARTYPYDDRWRGRLANAHKLSAAALMELHTAYGAFIGKNCMTLIREKKIGNVDIIASHGHTIYHQPKKRFTWQLGDGNAIHAVTSIPVVYDFRSLDIALGGQGAPFVPQGDKLLFSKYDGCLNLGGIANISMEVKGKRKAYDACFCNMALNFLMEEVGESYDRNGAMAKKGVINNILLQTIQASQETMRKKRLAIGREYFEKTLAPLLSNRKIPLPDKLRTVCEFIAMEVSASLPLSKKKFKLLVTGGGALNLFLIQLIEEKLKGKAAVIVPPKEIVEFKEALIFAFLGVLRLRNEINVLQSATRASRDSCCGVLVG